MNLINASNVAGAILVLIALMSAVLGWLRVVRPRLRSGVVTWVKIRDSLIGRDAVRDSITGAEKLPALPGIGVRMESVERAQVETRQAIDHIATLIEGQQTQDRRLENHEERITQLEEQTIERIAGKAESISAWRAVEAVAKQSDPTAPELEEGP